MRQVSARGNRIGVIASRCQISRGYAQPQVNARRLQGLYPRCVGFHVKEFTSRNDFNMNRNEGWK